MSGGHRTLLVMARTTSGYTCVECGWTSVKWVGRCGGCQAWDSLAERGAPVGAVAPAAVPAGRGARPITEVPVESGAHRPTGIAEFDRVLGGGLVPGAA